MQRKNHHLPPLSPDRKKIVLAQTVEQCSDDIHVTPVAGPSRAEIAADDLPVSDSDQPTACHPSDNGLTFTISDLILTTAFAAVGLALVRWRVGAIIAGVLGIVTIVALLVLNLSSLDSRRLDRITLYMAAMYSAAAAGAFAFQFFGESG